jgi:hypothetical protein
MVVTAYGGDANSLLAFDLVTEAARKGLAGFSIQAHPPNGDPTGIETTWWGVRRSARLPPYASTTPPDPK